MTIAVIGGTGGMGKTLIRFFRSQKILAKAIGRATQNPKKILENVDVIILSVPSKALSYAVNLLSDIDVSKKLIVSLGSIMLHDKNALKKVPAPVLHLHQLFGPQVFPFNGQRVIASGDIKHKFSKSIISIFKKGKVTVNVMKIEEHDKLMASIQALSQFSAITLAKSLAEGENSIDLLDKSASVTFKMSTDAIRRVMSQKAELWSYLQFENPSALIQMEKHLKNVQLMISVAKNKDYKKFEKIFNKTAKFWI